MEAKLKILNLEDSPRDFEIVHDLLQNAGFEMDMDVAHGKQEYEKFLSANKYDIILSDYNLPGYDGKKALELRNRVCSDIPFICISGTIGEEIATDLLKLGANDYVLKDRLERLPSAVKRAIAEAKEKAALIQMHEKLDQASDNWSKTFDAIQDGIFLLDADQRIIEVNQAFLDIIDITREEIIGQHCWPFVHNTSCPIDNCPFVKAQISKKRETVELKMGESEYEVMIDPIIDHNNNLTGAVHIIKDITERRKAERLLTESEYFFKESQRAGFIGSFKTDFIKGYWESSEVLDQIFGISKDYDRSISGWLDIVHPDDREMMNRYLSDEVILKHNPFNKEYRILRVKDGETRWVMGLGQIDVNDEGKVISMTGTIQDITERKQAEEALQKKTAVLEAQLNSNIDGILIVDKSGKKILQNQRTVDIWKIPKHIADNTDDKTQVAHVMHMTVNPEKFVEKIIYLYDHPNETSQDEVELIDGTVLERYSAPVIGESEQIYGRIWVFHDFTERKQIENLIIERESSLQYAQEISKMGSWEWVVLNKTTEWSPNYYVIFGLDPSKIKPSFELFRSRIYPEDVAFFDETYASISKEKKPRNFDLRIIQADGTVKWIQNFLVPFYEDDKLIKLKGAFIDITERKQAENLVKERESSLQYAQEIAKMGSWKLDTVTQKTVWSENSFVIYGYKPFEFVPTFEHFKKRVHPDDWHIIEEAFDDIYKNKTEHKSEIRIVLPDGNTKWLQINMVPVFRNDKLVELIGTNIDITERKQVELALKESEEKYRAIFNNVQDVFYQTDLNGIVLEISPSIIYFTEFTRDEIIGKPVQNIYHNPDDREILIKELQKKGEIKDYELILKPNKGEKMYVSVNARLIMDAKGQPHHIDGALRDISARKLAEDVTRESEERFRKVFEESQIGMVISGKDLLFEKVNPAFCKMMGYTSKELMSMSFIDITHPDEIDSGIENIKILENGTIPFYKVEKRYLTKSGKIIWVNVVVTNIRDKDGKLLYYLAMIDDITERRLIEEKLQASKDYLEKIINTVAYPIFVKDEEHKYYLVNTALCEMFGHSKEDIIGKSDNDFISEEQAKEFLIKDDEVYDSGKESKIEEEITDGTGIVKTLITTKTLYTDKDGKKFLVAIINDISERKQMELDLIKAKDKAEESDRLKSAFLANMSHEIRTPMNGILGFAELLKEPKLSGDKQQEFISIIEKSGVRLLNIINDLVNISKIESGLMNVYLSEVNINDQIEYIYKFFKPELENKGIHFSSKMGLSSNEAIVKTDREKIIAILTNLVGNAIKFTDKGSIEFGYNKKDSQLEFFVKDTGRGILNEQKEFIFKRFRQGSESLNRNYEGAGLGLSISRSYVEMLGGKIWVEINEGIGSTFYFTIPYNTQLKDKVDKSKTVLRKEKEFQKINLKILIAEDDEISLLLLKSAIDILAKEILIARTGKEAVDICRNNIDIDLILMDLKMPEMDGYEAMRQIRQFNHNVIIIAQTAFGLIGDREKAIEAGANDYISKPINVSKLEGLIIKHFNR